MSHEFGKEHLSLSPLEELAARAVSAGYDLAPSCIPVEWESFGRECMQAEVVKMVQVTPALALKPENIHISDATPEI